MCFEGISESTATEHGSSTWSEMLIGPDRLWTLVRSIFLMSSAESLLPICPPVQSAVSMRTISPVFASATCNIYIYMSQLVFTR